MASLVTPLALANIHAKRRWVVVLEEVESISTLATHLVRHSLPSSTRTRSNNIGITRGKAHASQVAGLAGLVSPRGLLVGRAAQLREAALSAARGSVAGGLEVLLVGEQEDDRACLAGVGGRDVEVEDGASGLVDFAVVRGAGGVIGRAGVDGDDQVRVLVVSIQVCRAGTGGLLSRWAG
jgi:hypothetical protein